VTTEPEPEVTTAPEVTTEPEPEVTTAPEVTTEPEPEVTTAPEVTTEPEPEVTTAPEVTTEPEPEVTTAPEVTTKPEPETTAKPETTVPETTTAPETTLPETTAGIENEGSALEEILEPAQITLLRPVASGVLTKKNDKAIIDYSNTRDGYVMVKFTVDLSVKLKVQVKGPTTTYTYNIDPFEWNVFPLSDGNGSYQVKVFRNTTGNKYANVLSETFAVSLDDEFAPFLRPNQYVNYENATETMNKAAHLVAGKSDLLEKVEAVYSFVVGNISYDYEEAATVQSGYLPDLDEVLRTRKGICFDYAALMTGMLRSQGIACKLVVGYAGSSYHAWISVWSPDSGWISGAIFFNGIEWQLMDPTFVSTGGPDATTGVTYTSKYIY
jgi:transglutaminase/protease-like cytokinesis protein 3